ncbi:Sgt2 small tetratricopeptide repeat (TPR)-containing protein [Candida orthopsilosis Co 90-125]|uniref:Sgt2 small tetratricopeptide repeat (TPR)-containing protein n=1 Tax=Candida orthopsilosis (strain 90-125) TaxID=1136231 RepID=H8WYS7_CANO9|nr:Sgt2 small tetratricopeptide repeat (TPR)-containing protein [Candida orthopsilosis Co 90-125]CCG21559.1 Sgt2 small tetratricopeptide repeat (TPR)-containing protein [Candida orthopsilosis Co 90-125]
MSSVSSKDIALSIIGFLKQSVADKTIAEDFVESMDVAIDCIADAFEVNKDDDKSVIDSKFHGRSLSELVKASVASSSSAGASEKESNKDAKPSSIIVDDATKERADQLKLEGNRLMGAKDYAGAIAKYTEAIGLDPTNVVYLSNRAAAYSSAQKHTQAVEDAEKAIKLNPEFSRAYSRLGLAQYALGNPKEAMEAYKKGLEVEGDKPSDGMKKGYETAKKRVEQDLENSISASDRSGENESESGFRSAPGTGAGGLPDFSSLFGGAGGSDNPFANLMNNPQMMQAAQSMMSNPGAMQEMLNNPAIRQMAQSLGLGGPDGPDLSNIMNNPMLNQFMGGRGNNSNNEGGQGGNNES